MDTRYSIKAAARLADLSVDTLRAWERRYSAVEPRRSEKGRRLYSDAEVERLSLLKRATDLGHPIGMLAALGNAELLGLIEKSAKAESDRAGYEPIVDQLIADVVSNNFTAFERSLGQAAIALPPRRLIDEVFFPLLKRVGDRWYEGTLTIAQEHAVSSNLRNLIGAMIRLFPRGRAHRSIVFATLSGERHEFGILLLALLAASEGIECHYLGPDLPAEEIARTVSATGSQVVALSMVHRGDEAGREIELRRLQEALGDRAVIWIGGAAAARLAPALRDLPIVFMHNVVDFERRLGELNAPSAGESGR